MPAERTRRWTAAEVRQLNAKQPGFWPRYELVDGELLVTPAPRIVHQTAVSELHVPLFQYCNAHDIGRALTSPSQVELEPEDLRQPDVFVVSNAELKRAVREGWPVRSLVLVAEVLSPSTARYDRVVKRPKYQRVAGEYWIVDTDARVVERWVTGEERPEILAERLVWSPPGASEPFVLDLAAYFRRTFAEDLE